LESQPIWENNALLILVPTEAFKERSDFKAGGAGAPRVLEASINLSQNAWQGPVFAEEVELLQQKEPDTHMTKRIIWWALAGFTVACCWFIYSTATAPNPYLARWTIVAITAPASLIGRTMPLAYYWFILLNAVIYAFVGLATELLRRPIAHYRSS
jgi:hypothetical protein